MIKFFSIAAIALTLTAGLSSEAKSKKSAKREAAKETCLAATPGLTGKGLKKCINSEMKK